MKSVQGLMTKWFNQKKANRTKQQQRKEEKQKTKESFSPNLKWTWIRQ